MTEKLQASAEETAMNMLECLLPLIDDPRTRDIFRVFVKETIKLIKSENQKNWGV